MYNSQIKRDTDIGFPNSDALYTGSTKIWDSSATLVKITSIDGSTYKDLQIKDLYAVNVHFTTAVFGGSITGNWNPSVDATYYLGDNTHNWYAYISRFYANSIDQLHIGDGTFAFQKATTISTTATTLTLSPATNLIVTAAKSVFGNADAAFGGAIIARLDSADTSLVGAPAYVFAALNLNMTANNWICHDFAGYVGTNTPFGFGRIGVQVNSRTGVGTASSTFGIALVASGTNPLIQTVSHTVGAWAFQQATTISTSAGDLSIKGGALNLQNSVAANINIWGTTAGTGRYLNFYGTTATNGQANDSPTFNMIASYDSDPTGGANATDWNYSILHDMITGGATPKSQAIHSINSLPILTLENNNSALNIYITGGLDVASGIIPTIRIGADNAGTSRTNATQKTGRIAQVHYTNAEENISLFQADSNLTYSSLDIGGGSGALNAVTQVSFWAGANTTQLTGTEMVRITTTALSLLSGYITLGSYINFTGSIDSSANPDLVFITGFDISAGHRALAIGCEEVYVNANPGAPDYYIPVRINGKSFKWHLTAI